MAKKSKNPENTLNSWDEADKCLREIGECEIAISDVEAESTLACNEIIEKAAKMTLPMKNNIAKLKAMVQEFVEEQKNVMGAKSKQLNFGKVGFRRSTSVSVPTKKVDDIIRNLKKFGMDDCVLPGKETVNKELLIRYPEKDIVKVGAALKVKDNFFLETDKVKVKG